MDVSPTEREQPCGSLSVHVELSSDDGVVEFSGTGTVYAVAGALQVNLHRTEQLFSGSLVLGDRLQVTLDFADGTLVTAQGSLEQ